MTDLGYSPDPPSRHPVPHTDAGRSAGTDVPANRFSAVLERPGYVSRPFYSVPPTWRIPSCSDRQTIIDAAQRAANESRMAQHIVGVGTVHPS